MFSASDAAPAAAGKQLQPYLANNGVLIFVPGRTTVRNVAACRIPSAHLKTLCRFALPILPIAIDCPRESCMSYERKSSLPSAVIVIGKPVQAGNASIAAFLQSLLEASEEAYSTRALLKSSLAIALLKGLKKHGSKKKILEGSDDLQVWTPLHTVPITIAGPAIDLPLTSLHRFFRARPWP